MLKAQWDGVKPVHKQRQAWIFQSHLHTRNPQESRGLMTQISFKNPATLGRGSVDYKLQWHKNYCMGLCTYVTHAVFSG